MLVHGNVSFPQSHRALHSMMQPDALDPVSFSWVCVLLLVIVNKYTDPEGMHLFSCDSSHSTFFLNKTGFLSQNIHIFLILLLTY